MGRLIAPAMFMVVCGAIALAQTCLEIDCYTFGCEADGCSPPKNISCGSNQLGGCLCNNPNGTTKCCCKAVN